VAKNLLVKSLAELIALAKKEPGKLTFGCSGLGGAHHLSDEMLRSDAKIDIVHVPYKDGAPAATDLMAGHLSFMFEMGYAALPSIRAGLVKPIAVTSTKRTFPRNNFCEKPTVDARGPCSSAALRR
jgi:tripartite-type tricarboxylate transporter receptor subunit TctC